MTRSKQTTFANYFTRSGRSSASPISVDTDPASMDASPSPVDSPKSSGASGQGNRKRYRSSEGPSSESSLIADGGSSSPYDLRRRIMELRTDITSDAKLLANSLRSTCAKIEASRNLHTRMEKLFEEGLEAGRREGNNLGYERGYRDAVRCFQPPDPAVGSSRRRLRGKGVTSRASHHLMNAGWRGGLGLDLEAIIGQIYNGVLRLSGGGSAEVDFERSRWPEKKSPTEISKSIDHCVLEYWAGRGMLQIFVAVMTRAYPEYLSDRQELFLFQSIASYLLLVCGVVYVNIRFTVKILTRYKGFKEGHKRILVATDFFGRGINIERVNMVINYAGDAVSLFAGMDYLSKRDLVGRAGRFGTKGLAITFVSSAFDSDVLNQVQERFEVDIKELHEQIDTSTYRFSELADPNTIRGSSPIGLSRMEDGLVNNGVRAEMVYGQRLIFI
ncbi:hypothetical protein CASFOL_042652 [Castilleja foliolosa]|uniref:Helicase C-terminal domain-containing protein n=1 Tax=Castilleja foliolosa TaxID=1961234 RepID=A0ABD3B8B5_9LAMI